MAGALDKPIADAVMRHALDITRVEASLRLRVMRRMLKLQRELVALVLTQEARTKADVETLLARSRKAIDKAYADMHEQLQPALTTIARTQAQHVVASINNAKVKKRA